MSKFVWFEYATKDIDKASGFFGELFGWTKREVPMGSFTYSMIAVGDRTIGGYSTELAGPQPHWLSHLATTDARGDAARAKALGGTVLQDATKVAEVGTMALVRDPHGAVFALWQSAKSEDAPAPTTNTFCWNELASADPEASVKFYAELGGFTTKTMQMDQGAYHVLESGGQPRAGIMAKMMPQQPHAWLPYVQVASADTTSDKAKKLGGAVIVPPTDIPNVGRFAILADPQGGAIGILQP